MDLWPIDRSPTTGCGGPVRCNACRGEAVRDVLAQRAGTACLLAGWLAGWLAGKLHAIVSAQEYFRSARPGTAFSPPPDSGASRRARIGADRRSAMRSVSMARAFRRAAPTGRRSTESAGARTCSSRSQNRASSEPVRSSRSASSSRNRASLFFGSGVERAQAQVLADALLMLRDRLLPAGVGVDRLGVDVQLLGREPCAAPRPGCRPRSPG